MYLRVLHISSYYTYYMYFSPSLTVDRLITLTIGHQTYISRYTLPSFSLFFFFLSILNPSSFCTAAHHENLLLRRIVGYAMGIVRLRKNDALFSIFEISIRIHFVFFCQLFGRVARMRVRIVFTATFTFNIPLDANTRLFTSFEQFNYSSN